MVFLSAEARLPLEQIVGLGGRLLLRQAVISHTGPPWSPLGPPSPPLGPPSPPLGPPQSPPGHFSSPPMTLPPPPRIPGSKDSRRVFVEDRAKFGYEACCSWHDKERQPIGGSQVSLCPTLSPLRRLNYPALKALSPKYSILPVRPIVQHVVGCGAVHGLVSAKRESKYRF